MRILADRHHEALWSSLVTLFEDRLGHELYHPWGLDGWFPEHWAVAKPYNNEIGTAKQFLEGVPPSDGTIQLEPTRGITFEDFKDTKFDVLIASYYPHIDVYLDLIKKYQPEAKLIAHYGNEWPPHKRVKNYLCSTAPFDVGGAHVVFYHQEFDLDLFHPSSVAITQVCSFVNALNVNDLFEKDWQDFLKFEDFINKGGSGAPIQCYSFGGGCRDGSLSYPDAVAELMSQSAIGFHLKTGGDGYGHVIHNWFACGRPVVYRGSQYEGRLAGDLLEHGVTGIDVDIVGIEAAAMLTRLLIMDESRWPMEYDEWSQNAYSRFKKVVDFDKEAQMIEDFMKELR